LLFKNAVMSDDVICSENDITTVIKWCSDILWKNDAQSVMIISLTTQNINRDQYSNTLSQDWKSENS